MGGPSQIGRVSLPLSQAVKAGAQRLRRFHGACACGEVRFEVTAHETPAVPCICPRCRGQDLRLRWVEPEAFRLITGEGCLTEPPSETRHAPHFYCGRCGEAVFGRMQRSDGRCVVSVNDISLRRGSPDDLTDPARDQPVSVNVTPLNPPRRTTPPGQPRQPR